MEVLVINLDESRDRLEQIKLALDKYAIPFTRIPAINGSVIERNEHPEIYKGSKCLVKNTFISHSILTGNLTDGELGCALSHLKAYNYILCNKLDGAIILEDDFVPDCNIVEVITNALKVKPKADIITGRAGLHIGLRNAFWNTFSKIPNTDRKIIRVGIPGFNWFFNRRRRHSSTGCYYISAKACSKLLFLAYPVRFESDVLTGMVAMNGLKYYSIQPPLGKTFGEATIRKHGGTKFI